MSSQVFFIGLRTPENRSLLDRIGQMIDAAGIQKTVRKKGLTAVKIHFGERGNTAFIRPLLVRPIVDAVRQAGGKPFLTDTGTLYVGSRGNAVDHLNTAVMNGFGYSSVGVPLVVADGIDGQDEVAVGTDFKHFKETFIASGIVRADTLISVAHFKLHEASGFGGAIKNIGMGCASRRGKMAQHSEVAPAISPKRCVGCGVCADNCAHGALSIVEPAEGETPSPGGKIARIDREKCVGCARCIHVCPQGALSICWATDLPRFMERMVEYAAGTLKNKEDRVLCF